MEKMLSLEHVLERVPVDRSTLSNWEADGKFPKRIKIKGRVFWRQSDIDRWIANGGMDGGKNDG